MAIGGRSAWTLAAVLPCALIAGAAAAADDKPDPLLVVHKIKAEAFASSQVAEHLFWLTDVNGPRLTNSPGYRAAAEWALGRLKAIGASKGHLEGWQFGRGWSSPRWSLQLVQPVQVPLAAVPRAWSGGTSGPVKGEVVYAPFQPRSERDDGFDLPKLDAKIAAYALAQKGKLRGKVVLFDAARDFSLPKEAAGVRYDDQKLAAEVLAPEPVAGGPVEWPLVKMPSDPKKRQAFFATTPFEVAADFSERRRKTTEKLWAFFAEEQPAAVLTTDERGEGGLIFVEGIPVWGAGAPNPPPALVVAPEAYDRLVRLVEKHVPAQVEVDVSARYHDETEAQNVVAELPGTGKKKDEVVIIGAHLDSWHSATGATDNAAGVAIMLEVVRILKALELPLDRTVRIVLWSGEEEGLLGSRAYVREHFADPVTMALKGEHAKVAAYFNTDNGAGKVRGVYLQGNDMVRPLFEKWLAPFRDQGATALSIRNTGGTDHLSFDAVGLPGFQFIQDPLDYVSRTHHSDLDTADHALPADLMQASAVVASFVYNAANHPELLPRKPLPKPLPPKRTLVPSLAAQ